MDLSKQKSFFYEQFLSQEIDKTMSTINFKDYQK